MFHAITVNFASARSTGFTRQGEKEGRALPQFSLHPNLAAVGLHDVFHDGKAKSRATRFPRPCAIGAIKSFEDPFTCLRWDTGAVILHPCFDSILPILPGSYDHVTLRSPILDRVLNQIAQ